MRRLPALSMISLVYALVGLLVAYKLYRLAREAILTKRWNCEPAYYIGSGFLGYKFFQEQQSGKELGFLLEEQVTTFREHGVHTYKTNVAGKEAVFTCNGENFKALIGTQFNNFSIGPRKQAFRVLIGNGIFASEGHRWKTSREMLRPQFAKEQVAHILTLEPHYQNFVSVIKSESGVFDIQDLFLRLTLDASSEFLFGESTRSLLDEFHFSNAFNKVQNVLTQRVLVGPFYWMVNPPGFKENVAEIHKSIKYFVDKALATPDLEIEQQSKHGYTFLYELVKHTRDPAIIQDELLSILLAGRNTTSGLLSALFFELARNPSVWQKLQKEVFDLFGKSTEKISFETMKRCTYLKYCINEALRMYPPVSRNMRVAKTDTFLPRGGGPSGESPIFVRKGSSVMMGTYACHHQEEVYGKDADTYRPERWEDIKPLSSFMPFGSGPRICLGQQFALTEASYITIRILQTFTHLSAGEQQFPPPKNSNATLLFREGVLVSFK